MYLSVKQKYKIPYIKKKHAYKKRKETTHGEIGENDNNIIKYISRINTMFAITKWSQYQCTRDKVSKRERKEKINKSSLHPSYIHKNTPPYKKCPILTLPLST